MENPPQSPQQNKKAIIAIIIVVALILGLIAYKLAHHPQQVETTETFVHKHGGPCPGETKIYTQQDPYMRGVIEDGQKFKVILNYYDCNAPQRGDLVFYQIHHSMDPVVKIVRGVEGDTFKLTKDNHYKAWNLSVNGNMIYSERDKKQAYFFGGLPPPPLALYEKSHGGKIGPGDVILLSSWPPGDTDSGLFGMFNMADVVGKVELMDNK